MIFFWLWKNSCLTVWSRRNPKPFNFIKDYYLSKQSYVKKDILIWTCRTQNVNIIWTLYWIAANFNEKIALLLIRDSHVIMCFTILYYIGLFFVDFPKWMAMFFCIPTRTKTDDKIRWQNKAKRWWQNKASKWGNSG